MAEELIEEKPIDPKGINTVTGDDTEVDTNVDTDVEVNIKIEEPPKLESNVDKTPKPKFTRVSDIEIAEAPEFSDPRTGTQSDAIIEDITQRSVTPGAGDIKGFTGLIDTQALEDAYAPMDLAEGIPDAAEREKFKAYHGEKLVNLVDENIVGVRFQKDLEDVYTFKEKQYPLAVKRFIDELDENQSWYTESALTLAKLIGKTGLAVAGGLVGSVYGAVSALFNWDKDKFFDNSFFDATEYLDEGLDKHLAIYGGSDVWDLELNPDTQKLEFKQKGFFSRFGNDPLKSLNQDVVPAVSFIAGAVVSELAAGAITAGTGGLGVGLLAANSARITNRVLNWGARATKFSKANRILRGLDSVSDLKDKANIEALTKAYRAGLGTITSGYRSSAYESALIARDTKEAALDQMLIRHHKEMGGTITADGRILDKDGNQLEEMIAPSAIQLAEYEQAASDAGESAYFMNVPLVAGANFIQMPRLFTKNYRVASAARQTIKSRKGIFDDFRLTGTRIVNGKRKANVDADKFLKTLGYGKAILKGPITEGFEEFAQGAMQEGLVDYYADNYSKGASRSITGMLSAISNKASAYANTTEGQDSMAIGAIMGLLGLRVPVFTRSKTSKLGFSLSSKSFGGSRQEYLEAKRKMETARQNAEYLNNEGNINPMLRANFENSTRHKTTQEGMDDAVEANNTYEFKNKEHQQLFSGVYNRVKLGLGDTVIQDIEALEDLSLDVFNEQFGTKGVQEFTEETKKEAIEKAKRNVASMMDSIQDVEQLLTSVKPDLIQNVISGVAEAFKKTPDTLPLNKEFINAGMREQMAYLNAAVQNTVQREKELTQQIQDITGSSLNINNLDKIVAQIVGVNLNSGKVEFTNRANEVKKEILKEYKENDPVGYSMNIAKIEPLIDDILKLKIRRGEAAKMYEGLFTPKGAKMFAGFQVALEKAQQKENEENLRKIIEEQVKNSRNASLEKVAKNEAGFNKGATPAVDERVTQDTVNGLKKIDDIKSRNLPIEKELEAIMNVLDEEPGLLTLVKARLQEKGVPLTGIKTAKEILLGDTEGNLIAPILAEIDAITLEASLREDLDTGFNAERVDQLNQSMATPGVPTKEEIKDSIEEGLFKFKGEANNYFTIINSRQYEIKNGKVVLDDKGKPKKHFLSKEKNYPANDKKINDPDFLPNALLDDDSNPQYFEFKISDNNYNKQEERSSDKIAIDVVHIDSKTGEETFISRLPSTNENSPQQLKNLREEIVRRDKAAEDTTVEERANRIQEIKKEKEVIKKKLQENLDTKKEDSLTDKLKAEEERQTLLDKIKPNTLTKKERKLIIAKALLKGKSLKEAQKEAGYVEVQGIMIAPDAPIEILKLADQVIWEALVARGISYIETSDSDGHGAALSHSKNNKTYAWGIDLSKGLIDFFKEKSKDFPGDTKSRINHVLAHELGHKVWQNDLTDAQKQIVENTKEKADYVKRLEEGTVKSSAGSVEENFTENFAWDLTKKLTGESERSVFTELQELMDDINSDVVSETTQPTTEITEEEFKEFTDNATVSDARINAIVNKIKTGTELTTQEQAMREEKAEQVEEALKEDTTTELDAEQAELKSQLNDLNKELKDLAGDIKVTFIEKEESIFDKISDLSAIKSKKRKQEKENEIEKDFGKENIKRANAINNNFQDIVTAIQTSGIQIFLNPETKKHENC